jgi:hypothetical protein
MLEERLEKGDTAMAAAEKADRFASVFATNMGLPDTTEPPKEGMDKYLSALDKVVSYCDEHPKTLEFVTGAATFLLGALAGRASDQSQDPPPAPLEPIDMDQLQ